MCVYVRAEGVEGGPVNITHCVLAPVTDGRGRGHPLGRGYLFLCICVLCVRLRCKKSVYVNTLHCMYLHL